MLPAPHSTVAEQVAPPTSVMAAVLVLVPTRVGAAVVGGVAESAAGRTKVTLPAAPEGMMVPNRISAGCESVRGGTTVVTVVTLPVSASAGLMLRTSKSTTPTKASVLLLVDKGGNSRLAKKSLTRFYRTNMFLNSYRSKIN
jgi:hypothetical protein